MQLVLGCIADDITGASDLGLMLAANGLPTTLVLGVPESSSKAASQAIVVALKIRTADKQKAVDESTAAAHWLRSAGARQLYYKYCSTFDSTANGNIGPVTDALLALTGADITVLLPAFPENGRTVRGGKLFVNGVPLSESPMRNHPLTPMKESSLIRLMDAQTATGNTGLIDIDTVRKGSAAVRDALQKERDAGRRYVAIDTVEDEDFAAIADVVSRLPLVTGGSGIAAALPAAYREQGVIDARVESAALPALPGHAAILAGSCSEATRRQIAAYASDAVAIVVDPLSLHQGETHADALANEAVDAVAEQDVLVYSSTAPEDLKTVQAALGTMASAAIVEGVFAHIAKRLSDSGVRKFVVAGGETSGAVAHALGVDELSVSQQIDPGVPWMVSLGNDPVCLAFKSGNFGGPDFFSRALGMLP
ncbi:MAG: 3-oxo-tetronate kinase [Pseudomonadota bacterium]